MRYIDTPAKVLEASVTSSVGLDRWPYDDGRGDPFWEGGAQPQPYRWEIILTVETQSHSGYRTREPFKYNGMDIKIGDYIADSISGTTVKIISISSKSETECICVVEDELRYNTLRSSGGFGFGMFSVPATAIIFEVNEEYLPVIDPVPESGLGPNFFTNLMSRFQNVEQNYNYLLAQESHGFALDDVVSAAPEVNGFVKTDIAHPYILGTVSNVDLGPDHFMINPIQKINTYDYLVGDIGDVIYADDTSAGDLSLVGNNPVMIKLRNHTKTSTQGSIYSPSTAAGSEFKLNGVLVYLNEGSTADMVSSVNEHTADTGVTASLIQLPTEARTDAAQCAIGEPAVLISFVAPYTSITINGYLVEFTVADEIVDDNTGYVLEQGMASAINAADIPNIRAVSENNQLIIYNDAGGPISITNVVSDVNGNPVAGPSSGSGVVLETAANDDVAVRLEAVDARAINLFDTYGTAISDFGLTSAENGTKAAAIFIEQGIRRASTYVVPNITGRDAINALFGDQCFVQDKGNGEWGHYIRTLSNVWVKIADKDSSDTDAQTVEIEIDHETASDIIYTVSGGSRVTFVTVTVTEQFNGLNPLISVGDEIDTGRLMTNDQNDLKSLGTYSTTPSYIYSGSQDVDITFTFDAANSTSGKAVIAISYT